MALTATIVASRESGMTPLAVFFEATASVDAAGNKIGDSGGGNGLLDCDIVEYHWDFGDGTTATGFVAAHVFEPSGDAGANGEPSGAGDSYTVTLTVTDSSDNTDTDTVGITVDAFAGTTYYVRSDGNDANDGDGPSAGDAWQTYDKARTAVAGNSIVAPGDRVLFNRGDTFAYTTASSLGVMANVLLAAYGTGDRPLVQYAGTGSSEAGAAITTASTASALSYMDIEFDCESTADSSLAYGCNTWMDNILLLRVDLGNTYSNVFYTDGLFVVESAISGSRNMYYNGERLAVLDSDLGPCTETHNIYGSRIERGVISGASFHNTALVAIRVSAQSATGDTYNVIVSGNEIDSIYTGVLVGSSSGTPVYNLYNVQVERNHISNATEGFKTHKTTPTGVIVRNNIIESSTIPVFVSDYVSPGGGPNEGIKGLRFYNNTIDATVNLPARIQTDDHEDVEFINNIIRTTSSASATRWVTVELAAGMGELTFDYNLYHAPNRVGDPDLFDVEGTDYTFTEWRAETQDVNSPSPADPDFNAGGATGYELEDTSPAIGAGDTLALVREDYATPTTVAGTAWRPQGADYDIGAFEFEEEGTPTTTKSITVVALNAMIESGFKKPRKLSVPIDRLSLIAQKVFANGTGADQVNQFWHGIRTVTGAPESLDLAGGLTDALGTTVAFTKAKLLFVHNKSRTPGEDLTLSGSFLDNDVLGGGSSTIILGPDGWQNITSPIDGYTVTAATGDILTVDPGANTITYDIVIAGTVE